MNILMANKYYYHKGGSETSFFNSMQLLESKDHHVIAFSMHHPQNKQCAYAEYFVSGTDLQGKTGFLGRAKALGRILYSTEARDKIKKLLILKRVDVAHLHNIYHHLSPSIIVELKSRGIPIVMTLHDYKMVCPLYRLSDYKGICERCAGGRYTRALTASCGQGFLERASLALEMYLHHKIFKFYDLVDVFISPSRFLKEKLLQMGFEGEIQVLPNFIDTESHESSHCEGRGIVYFGRLSGEKGLYTLLNAAKDVPGDVRIIGDGPLRTGLEEMVRANQLKNVRFLGYLKGEQLNREIDSSQAVVVPSECYENNPLSIIEAFALSKPVVGSRIGGIPELVHDGKTGLTFEAGNAYDLKEKIVWLHERPEEARAMGRQARRFVEEKLNADKHYEKLMSIYRQVMERSAR